MNEGWSVEGYHAYWTCDGVPVTGGYRVDSESFHVVSVALDQPLNNREYIMGDRGSCRSGGVQLCEIIGYNRRLTAQERHDTQAYLLKKWKGVDHPDDAPVRQVGEMAYADGETAELQADVALAIDKVEASGTLVKDGAGAVALNRSDANGIDVRAGVLTFADGDMVPCYMHLDASTITEADTFVDESGVRRVHTWRDPSGNGLYARTNGVFAAPIYVADKWNGLPALDFGPFCNPAAVTSSSMFLSDDEIFVREAFVVMADHDDDHTKSAFFLSCTRGPGHGSFAWHRGDGGSLFAGFAADNIEYGLMSLNGEAATKDDKLQDGVNVFSIAITNGEAQAVRSLVNDRYDIRNGGMVISEVYLFKELLSPAQRTKIVRELQYKWQGRLAAASARARLAVAAGATLNLTNQHAGTAVLAGGGTVSAKYLDVAETLSATSGETLNVTAPEGFVLEDGADIALDLASDADWSRTEVNGPVTLAGAGTITINVADGARLAMGVDHVILAGTSLKADEIKSWCVQGNVRNRYGVRITASETALSVRLLSPGTLFIVK